MGLIAVNDALWIEGTMYKILRRHFRNEPYYLNIVELFHEVLKTVFKMDAGFLISSNLMGISLRVYLAEGYSCPSHQCAMYSKEG